MPRAPEASVKTTARSARRPWVYIALGIAGGAVLACASRAYQHHLHDLAARHEWAEANHLMVLTIRGAAIVSLVLAVAFWLPAAIYGGRVLLARRWPLSEAQPPAARQFHGPRALLFGLLVLITSLAAGSMAVYAGVVFWHEADVTAAISSPSR